MILLLGVDEVCGESKDVPQVVISLGELSALFYVQRVTLLPALHPTPRRQTEPC